MRADQFIAEATEIAEGDLVVHQEYGIGRYDGLTTLTVNDAPHDCLRLIYDGDEKLFLPVENIEVLSRYGSDQQGATLDKLGGVAWQTRKAKMKQRIRDMAGELIKIAAARQLHDAEIMAPPEGSFDEFCARFPFAETEDQSRAIADVLEDLASGRPMDRLICGDVGFGKTEVALRAAFVAAMSGAQVAVVVPTTLLSRQHFRTFSARFAGLPIKVAQLSRMVTTKEANEVRRGLTTGEVNIVVGTHALLSKSIQFSDLGLLVVDEEQHFGVAHKERLKAAEGRRARVDSDGDADPADIATGADRRAGDEFDQHAAGRSVGGAHVHHAVRFAGHTGSVATRALPRRSGVLCRAAHRGSRPHGRASARDRAGCENGDGARTGWRRLNSNA